MLLNKYLRDTFEVDEFHKKISSFNLIAHYIELKKKYVCIQIYIPHECMIL